MTAITTDEIKKFLAAKAQVEQSERLFLTTYKTIAREFNQYFVKRLNELGIIKYNGSTEYSNLYRELGKYDSLYSWKRRAIRDYLLTDEVCAVDLPLWNDTKEDRMNFGVYEPDDEVGFVMLTSVPLRVLSGCEFDRIAWVETFVQEVVGYVEAAKATKATLDAENTKKGEALFNRNYHLARKAVEAKGGSLTVEQYKAMLAATTI